jgi:hypothetical protein
MEERNERNAGKTGRHISNTTRTQINRYFSTNREKKKKNQKFTRGPFILSRKKKKEKV